MDGQAWAEMGQTRFTIEDKRTEMNLNLYCLILYYTPRHVMYVADVNKLT